MAKITREQFNKWDAQAKNDFHFDLQWFLIWNEKQLIKSIKQPDNTIIQFVLTYNKEVETKTNEHGCKWNVDTGRKVPVMRIDKLIPSPSGVEGVYIVNTIKDYTPAGEPEKTMKYSTLCKISGTIDTESELNTIQ